METEEFVRFCEEVYKADYWVSGADAVRNEMLLRSVYLGYRDQQYTPPLDDDAARLGYRIGVELKSSKGISMTTTN